MTAREMFEKLGYQYIEDGLFIECEINEEMYFSFSKTDKQITIGNYSITVDEIQAINQQCKELGWI